MAKIRIYIARHLCTAPRPQKEADALAAAGHVVTVHGIAYDPVYAARDTALATGRDWAWQPVANFARGDRMARQAWWLARLRHRCAKEWFELTGRVLGDVWSVGAARLAAHALTHPADLTIAHSEAGLWFGARLQHAGRRVGVDFEDWFSRDLSLTQRRGRPTKILATLERQLLEKSTYRLATSLAMARALAEANGTTAPTIIYNTVPLAPEPPPPVSVEVVRLHWFSLVIGPERGLETLVSALPLLRGHWRLLLRGEVAPDYRRQFLSSVPEHLRARIEFQPTIAASALPAALAEHDIGLALDVSAIESRNLTVTNKLFHYLQAGLAVAATATAGHREVLEQTPGAGALFPPGDAIALASVLNHWIEHRTALLEARRTARAAFALKFAHEQQAPAYTDLVRRALHAA